MTTEHHRLIFISLVSCDTTVDQQTRHSELQTPYLLSPGLWCPCRQTWDTHNRLALLKSMLLPDSIGSHSHYVLPLCKCVGYKQAKPESNLVSSWGAQTATTLQFLQSSPSKKQKHQQQCHPD